LTSKKPPLDIEQAIDLILATPAMFSKKSEGQREFGKMIVEEYYLKLRVENKDDPIAYRYLVNLFAAISSAVRAFGVQRDIFETSWKAIDDIKKAELEAAKSLTDYSPFREGQFWKKLEGYILGGLGGGGLGFVIGALLARAEYPKLVILGFVIFGVVIGIILLDVFLQRIKHRRIKQIMNDYPVDLTKKWKEETLPKYRKIIKDFLYTAIKLREEFYPDLSTIGDKKVFAGNTIPHISFGSDKSGDGLSKEEIESFLDKVIERHFAF